MSLPPKARRSRKRYTATPAKATDDWATPREVFRTESVEQQAVVAQFRATYPKLQRKLFAVPNGGFRKSGEARVMVAEGAEAGVPDLILAVARDPWHVLLVEMKRKQEAYLVTSKSMLKSSVKPEQMLFARDAWPDGNLCVVAWGADHALKQIELFLNLPSPSDPKLLTPAGAMACGFDLLAWPSHLEKQYSDDELVLMEHKAKQERKRRSKKRRAKERADSDA